MKNKNIGQKVSFDRFFDSAKLLSQKLIFSSIIGSIFYAISFHFLVGIKYIFIPLKYLIYSVLYAEVSKFSPDSVDQKILEMKFFHYKKMNSLLLDYSLFSIAIFIFSSSLFFIILTRFFNKKGKILSDGTHHRGLKVVTKYELELDIKKEIESNETGLKYSEKDLYVGKENIRIPRALGSSMWAFLGNAGTGKSQGISHMLLQIREFEEKVMIVDPAGEYYKKFGRKDDVILSLYDVRSELYSFWNEGIHPLRIAKALIEDIGGSNEFWSKAGQALFAGLLELNDTEKGIYESLFLPYDELKDRLKEKKLAAGIVLGEAEQAGSVLSTAAVDLVWLNDMNFWPKKCGKIEPFSINSWVRNNSDKRWVFLTCSDKHWSTAKHLIRLWTDIAVLSAFERGESKENVPIWLVCDEISTIGKLPSMSLLEDRGRKYNMGLIAGFQTPSQLETIYGKALTKVIIQGLQNQICFRAGEQEMLDYMSQLCGEAEYIQTTSSNTFGIKNSESISNQITRRRNVLADEFKALKNMNAYLKIAGHNPTKIKIDYLNMEQINTADASYMPWHDQWDGTLDGIKMIKDEPIFESEIETKNIEIKDNSETKSVDLDVNLDVKNDHESYKEDEFFDLSKISF